MNINNIPPEKELKGHKYRIGRLTGWIQDHVARKLAPALFTWATIEETGWHGLMHIAKVLGSMSDDDYEYCAGHCLAAVHREDAGKWVPIMARGSAGLMQYDDIDLKTRMELMIAVIEENLTNFFPGSPAETSLPSSNGQTQEPQ